MAFTYTGENVQEQPIFKLPPVGDYDVQIIKGEEGISKAGANMIKLTVKILHPEYKNEMWEFIVDNQYAQQRIHDILTACGTAPIKGQAVTGQTFVGKTAKVRIKHEQYNGETQLRVNYWKRPTATAVASTEAPQSRHDVNEEIPF